MKQNVGSALLSKFSQEVTNKIITYCYQPPKPRVFLETIKRYEKEIVASESWAKWHERHPHLPEFLQLPRTYSDNAQTLRRYLILTHKSLEKSLFFWSYAK